MSRFLDAFERVVELEGALSMDPRDPGNWTGGSPGAGELRGTKYGISAKAYPSLEIASLTLGEARDIYRRDYWDAVRGDELPWPWAFAVFDAAVNQGVGAAVRMMQDALGVLVDGVIGPRTLAAAAAATDRQLARFFSRRVQRYMRASTFNVHADGWITRAFLVAMEAS